MLIVSAVLQRARKVVLSDWEADEFLEDIDDVFRNMALKGIVNVVSSGDSSIWLNNNPLSPMVTSNPDDGMSSLHACVVHHEGLSCCKWVREWPSVK